MRTASALLAVCTCVISLGCSASLGASAGLTVDTAGHIGALARGHAKSGGRNTNEEREVAIFWLPQLSAGGGWDFTRGGPRLELGLPFVGFTRVPHGPGWVYGAQTHFRVELIWPAEAPMQAELGPALSFSLGRVQSYETKPPKYSDWPSPWYYDVTGGTVDVALQFPASGDDGTTLELFAGPYYENLTFYHMGLGTEPDDAGETQ